MTVRDLVTSAFRLIGVVPSGETASAALLADGMQIFSDLLGTWATERLTVPAVTIASYALVAGTQRYTLGSGGTWNGARPPMLTEISAAYVTAAGLEIPIDVLTRSEWERISDKALESSLPSGIFINPVYPLAEVDVYPVPTDATVQIKLYTRVAALSSVTSLDTVLSVSEGWPRALRYNLAVELSPEYPLAGGLDPAILAIAIDSKAAIQRVNEPLDEMQIDSALLSRRGYSGYRTNFDDL